MKLLIGLAALGRPKTLERCLKALLSHTNRNEVEIILLDQDASPEVKEVIYKYKKDFDDTIVNKFNTGIVFGHNLIMARYRKPGQNYCKIDDDVLILNSDWLSLFQIVLQDPKIGSCLGRRPTLFIDEPSRFEFYRSMPKVQINEVWVEVATGGLIGCFWIIKGEVLDKIGHLNEVTQNDDWDYWYRMKLAGWESCYIPDAVIKQPFEEPIDHPTYGIMKQVIEKNRPLQNVYNAMYNQGHLYLGTRFAVRDGDMISYLNKSQANYEEFERYSKEVK